MSTNKTNIQDTILNHARKEHTEITIYLANGVPLRGQISSFDNFTIIIMNDGKQSLIYKHAISTIVFPKEFQIDNLISETDK